MTIYIMVCTIYMRNEFKGCIFSRTTGSCFSISKEEETSSPNYNLAHPIHALDILLVDKLVQLCDDVFAVRVSLQVIDVRLHLAKKSCIK